MTIFFIFRHNLLNYFEVSCSCRNWFQTTKKLNKSNQFLPILSETQEQKLLKNLPEGTILMALEDHFHTSIGDTHAFWAL